jgi:hypothetical protein
LRLLFQILHRPLLVIFGNMRLEANPLESRSVRYSSVEIIASIEEPQLIGRIQPRFRALVALCSAPQTLLTNPNVAPSRHTAQLHPTRATAGPEQGQSRSRAVYVFLSVKHFPKVAL